MKKFFIGVLVFSVIVGVLLVAVRFYNEGKYKEEGFDEHPLYFKDVTDISLYPQEGKGVDVQYIDYRTMQGFHFQPEKPRHPGVVICYGGSEGSPNFETAKELAEEGYETFALFMFGMKNQQKTLAKIPLEQFEDVLAILGERGEIPHPITVLGASKGAEYALHLGAKYDEISNLVLYAPSAYTFSGLDFQNYGSSWTVNGEDIPFIDIKKSSLFRFFKYVILPSITNGPVEFRPIYESSIQMDPQREEKIIPAKKFQGEILMIAGEEDSIWGSVDMAKIIKRENPRATLLAYENAGHIFFESVVLQTQNMRMKIGGTVEGNMKAKAESDQALKAFLQEVHGDIH